MGEESQFNRAVSTAQTPGRAEEWRESGTQRQIKEDQRSAKKMRLCSKAM
jgi:hypothetical protein